MFVFAKCVGVGAFFPLLPYFWSGHECIGWLSKFSEMVENGQVFRDYCGCFNTSVVYMRTRCAGICRMK